jgi:RNA ligase (TIGR02306 family)
MSTHAIEIVEIKEVLPHPDPEVTKMELTHVWGWQCCIGKGQFKVGDKAIYVPPDYNVPTANPLFAFLYKEGKSQQRITVRRFRGTLSQGLIVNVPPELADLPVGSNVMDALGIERYEPPMPKSTYGNYVSAPSGLYLPKFDVESYQRYAHLFTVGEPVVLTEKLHGANGRFTYAKNPGTGEFEQYCGSRTNWMGEDEKNIWWLALRQNPAIGEWCRANPERVMYGEVFGQVQSLKYGAKRNDIFFATFAMLDQQRWLDYDEYVASAKAHGVMTVPEVYRGPLDVAKMYEIAEGESVWPNANHLREGVVMVPEKERFNEEIGRVCLKVVSNRYLAGH